MNTDATKLQKKHHELVHSEARKVVSHVQRDTRDWIINTIMIEGCNVPFRFKRKQAYQNVEGRRVNLTYYPSKENVAGMELEVMRVVRIKIA